jgi:hypothetical protein
MVCGDPVDVWFTASVESVLRGWTVGKGLQLEQGRQVVGSDAVGHPGRGMGRLERQLQATSTSAACPVMLWEGAGAGTRCFCSHMSVAIGDC